MSATPMLVPTALDRRSHRRAMQAPLSEVAGELQRVLSRRLTAVMVNVRDGKTIARWAAGDTSNIRNDETERRLRVAYQIMLLLLEHESEETVRAWFIGMDPTLNDTSPADAIRAGRLAEALDAARFFVVDG